MEKSLSKNELSNYLSLCCDFILAKNIMQPAPLQRDHFSYPVAREAKEEADNTGLSSAFSSSTASPVFLQLFI